MAAEAKKPKFELAITFVKNEKDLYCLVLETNEDSPHRGQWVAPTEGIEPGETSKYAAIRSMDEEAGIWGEITSDPYTKEKTIKGGFIRQHYFSAELIDFSAKFLDKPEYGDKQKAWLSANQILSLKMIGGKQIASYVPQIMMDMGLV
jgi:ADP-ribose pyrophosphatase YjhB (NUDIX family)